MVSPNNANSAPIERINPEDLKISNDTPQNIQDLAMSLLYQINVFIGATNQTLYGNLRIGTNLKGQVNNLTVSTPVDLNDFQPISIALTSVANPSAVLVGSVDVLSDSVQMVKSNVFISDWTLDAKGNLIIQYIAGLQPNTKYSINIVIF